MEVMEVMEALRIPSSQEAAGDMEHILYTIFEIKSRQMKRNVLKIISGESIL